MTDQPTSYRSPDARTLTIDAARGWGKPDHVHLSIKPEPTALIGAAPFSMFIPTARLLAMIDTEDPDAMRAYLRETAPEVIADHYRPVTPEQLDAVPVADSPEDVDEHAVIELSDDIDTRLHVLLQVLERLAKILPAGTDPVEVCTLADWVIDR